MRKFLKHYSAVEILLVIVIIGLIALIGVYIWKTKHLNVYNPGPDPSTHYSASSAVNDPYKGWKTYCDTTINACFMYPADWADVEPLQAPVLRAFGQNKTGTMSLEYSEPVTGKDGLGNFYTKSISIVAAARNPAIKVVGGYYTASNLPGYHLIDLSLLNQLSLVRGKVSPVGPTTGLFFSKNTTKAELVVHMNNLTGNPTVTTQQADDWLGSFDGKLAEKILQSFYFK